MTNSKIYNGSKTKKSAKIINFPLAKSSAGKKEEETGIVDFTVFTKCLTSGRNDWKGRAYAVLSEVNMCLFWEELLFYRKMLAIGKISYLSFRYQTLLAENDLEHCRAMFELHLMKAVRKACALNAELRNNIGERFITRMIKRSDQDGPYNYCPVDSLKLVHAFEDNYENHTGGAALRAVRWDLKLKKHNEETQWLAA